MCARKLSPSNLELNVKLAASGLVMYLVIICLLKVVKFKGVYEVVSTAS